MIDRLAQALEEKSLELNLFSSGDRLKLREKHIPDSLAVLPFWKLEPGQRVMDLGTGGGLPGLALAASCPDSLFTLVDAREKKTHAVQEVADAVGLLNVVTLSGRFEVLAHEKKHREQYDLVVARAVAPLPVLLEYVAGFLKVGGRLYAWKGPEYALELQAASKAMQALAFTVEKTFSYTLPGGEERFILSFLKTAKLMDSFPRKDGVPKAKPLV